MSHATRRALRRAGLVDQVVDGRRDGRWSVAGRSVHSLVSTSYLGLDRHPAVVEAACGAVRRWGTQLGAPRTIAVDRPTLALERAFARLVGAERALAFSSTTAAMLDLVAVLGGRGSTLLLDAWAYSTSRQAARAAQGGGAVVQQFRHDDADHLAWLLRRAPTRGPRLVLCDGVYSAGGQPAALPDLQRVARRAGALLVIDDAHGVGVLGGGRTVEMPYGHGGAGTAAWWGIGNGNIVNVATLGKALGVPLAIVAGPARYITQLQRRAPSMAHSSPPALPLVAAAHAALAVHDRFGETLRRRLLANVRRFRAEAARLRPRAGVGQCFPIQTIPLASLRAAARVAGALRARGVVVAAQDRPPDHHDGAVLRVVVRATPERRSPT